MHKRYANTPCQYLHKFNADFSKYARKLCKIAFLVTVAVDCLTVLKVSARVEKSVPHYRGDYEFSILAGGTFTFKTVSPCQQTDESNNCCDMELLINYQLKYNLLMY